MDGGGGGRRYGGGHYGGGGGGRHRYGGRRGGRGGRHRHHPYNNRSRGPRHGGGGGGRGNRFGSSNSYQDQQANMVRQIHSIVSRVGELKNIREEDATPELRAVESATARNVNDVTAVLCSQEKLNVLLRFQPQSAPMVQPDGQQQAQLLEVKPEDEFGKLVHLVVSCAGSLPLQTPCYAALTLSVHEQVKGGEWDGFAGRCVNYAMQQVSRDLDMILLQGTGVSQGTCRLKLMLRYLAILARMNVVKGSSETDGGPVDPSRMTVVGLLCVLVDAATAAAEQHNNINVVGILAVLVLSTLPYIKDYASAELVNEKIIQPLESIFESYKSTFTPGTGITSILLKEEQQEEDGDDDEEEDDDDDDDDEGSSGQICDSLQDLMRATNFIRNGEPTRFGLLTDSPWKGLTKQVAPIVDGEQSEPQAVTYVEEPLYLAFTRSCQALGLLLQGEGNLKLQCYSLEGVVFGRLPIFGSPPDPEDEDDEEDMDQEAKKNEQLHAFTKGYTRLDRFFVAEALRECIISHESHVGKTGTLRGSAKHVAEELLSICFVFSGGETAAIGMEYAILETLLGLLSQCTESGSLRHIYLSRVILELTRLQPSRLSPALALAMTNLFQDYLPALSPTARENMSRWFSFHLINTDYQWPSAYWSHWEPYVVSNKPGSRGSFVRSVLNLMTDNLSNPDLLVTECLPKDSALADHLFGISKTQAAVAPEDSPISSFEREVQRRLWDENEDPEILTAYLVGDDIASTVGGTMNSAVGDFNQIFWRTGVLTRAILDPARQEHERLKGSIDRARQPSDDMMDDDGANAKDASSVVGDCIARYYEALSAAITKDVQDMDDSTRGHKSQSELIVYAEAYLLGQVDSVASYSRGLMVNLVKTLFASRVVSGLGVIQWALGDTGVDMGSKKVVERWWAYASIAAKMCVTSALEKESNGGDAGMVIDVTGVQANHFAAAQARAIEVIKPLETMMQYAVSRVCSILTAETSEDQKKSLTPLQVDLVEGVKALTLSCHTMLQASFAQDGNADSRTLTRDDIHQIVENSALSGKKLASQFASKENIPAIELARMAFDCL